MYTYLLIYICVCLKYTILLYLYIYCIDDCSIKNKSYASISHQQGSTTLVAKIDLNPVSEGMVNNIEQCRDTSTLRQSIESSGMKQDFFPVALQHTKCPQYWSRQISFLSLLQKSCFFFGVPSVTTTQSTGSTLTCRNIVNNIVQFSYLRPLTDAIETSPTNPIFQCDSANTRALIQRRSEAAKLEDCDACSHTVWNNQAIHLLHRFGQGTL